MARLKSAHRGERGATLLEFAIVATVLLTTMFGIIEFNRLYWTHSALQDAARRGARYAITRTSDAASQQAVKNMVVYGDPNANPATATPLINGLTTSNVAIEYQNYNGILLSSRATVSITNYKFKFDVPLIGTTISLGSYRTSLPGESAGIVPCNISSATPYAPCNIIPN
jgi:Flp pilus assembly protein TadG